MWGWNFLCLLCSHLSAALFNLRLCLSHWRPTVPYAITPTLSFPVKFFSKKLELTHVVDIGECSQYIWWGRKKLSKTYENSCLTFCNPMGCSLPASSVHGIFLAVVLEWITISFSKGSSQCRDRARVSLIVDRHFTV